MKRVEEAVKFESLKGGVVKRREHRILGVFIDGTGLDRATRRLNRKVDLSRLLKGIASGAELAVGRYYTLIPYEDDSRQRAFLDAVFRAGLQVVVKRLPPKGISRQVSVDVEMAADIIAFAMGKSSFSSLGTLDSLQTSYTQGSALPSMIPFGSGHNGKNPVGNGSQPDKSTENSELSTGPSPEKQDSQEKRMIVVVCPSRDLAYPISLAKELNVDTASADFGQFNQGDVLKSAAKWIDLSDSETIWRD